MPKILVVEDMPDSAELAAQILRRYGHEVLVAPTGEEGLRLAQKHKPDLIVYDYWLPDIDARNFLARLRVIPGLDSTPVLACTATPPSTMKPGLGGDGFSGLLNKPYRVSSFMQAVDDQLN